MSRTNLITAFELRAEINNPSLRIFDCRHDLGRPEAGRKEYMHAHIPSAVFCALDEHLSDPVGSHGGRHPLPSIERMESVFSALGIQSGVSEVVAYDDAGGSWAARLWWMLRYLGHDCVRILDGGFTAWKSLPGDTEMGSGTPPAPAVFRAEPRLGMRADIDEVKGRADGVHLVDARAAERYRGDIEPIDPVAGHIPGAVNLPWAGNHSASLHLLPAEQLRARYENLHPESIFYCGSGVTSCISVLAMEEAGLGMPRLYTGSWSDWISWPDNPIATGD